MKAEYSLYKSGFLVDEIIKDAWKKKAYKIVTSEKRFFIHIIP